MAMAETIAVQNPVPSSATVTAVPRVAAVIVDGDVCAASGPVDAPGDLRICGNVADLMSVTACGSTQVDGVIEAAEVRVGRHLRAAGGITGRGKGRCKVGGSVLAKYVANASLDAGGDVRVTAEIVESRVTCGGELSVEEGSILASHVTAAAGIRCVTAGSETAVETILEAGVDDALRAMAREKLPDILERQRRAQKIKESVEPLLRNQKTLNAQQKEKATELLFEAEETESQTKAAMAPLAERYDASRVHEEGAVIRVASMAHAGVSFRFAGAEATLARDLAGPVRVICERLLGEWRVVAIEEKTESKDEVRRPLSSKPIHDDVMDSLRRSVANKQENP
jgi:uncharacterized protein (DUF342 family)